MLSPLTSRITVAPVPPGASAKVLAFAKVLALCTWVGRTPASCGKVATAVSDHSLLEGSACEVDLECAIAPGDAPAGKAVAAKETVKVAQMTAVRVTISGSWENSPSVELGGW